MAGNDLRSRCWTPDEQATARIVIRGPVEDPDELVDVLALTAHSRRTPRWVLLGLPSEPLAQRFPVHDGRPVAVLGEIQQVAERDESRALLVKRQRLDLPSRGCEAFGVHRFDFPNQESELHAGTHVGLDVLEHLASRRR